jgi:hypothetical protein
MGVSLTALAKFFWGVLPFERQGNGLSGKVKKLFIG